MITVLSKKIWDESEKTIQIEKTWIADQIEKIGNKKLVDLAKSASLQRNMAYVPYSNYKVGVAILTESGKTYLGNNAERAGLSETDHAEESALTSAIIHGEIKKSGRKFLVALACSHASDTAPCGRCRQIMAEHTDNCLVLVVDTKGGIRKITSLKTLLPYAFTPTDLGIK